MSIEAWGLAATREIAHHPLDVVTVAQREIHMVGFIAPIKCRPMLRMAVAHLVHRKGFAHYLAGEYGKIVAPVGCGLEKAPLRRRRRLLIFSFTSPTQYRGILGTSGERLVVHFPAARTHKGVQCNHERTNVAGLRVRGAQHAAREVVL